MHNLACNSEGTFKGSVHDPFLGQMDFIKINNGSLNNEEVMYVPDMRCNLMSLG